MRCTLFFALLFSLPLHAQFCFRTVSMEKVIGYMNEGVPEPSITHSGRQLRALIGSPARLGSASVTKPFADQVRVDVGYFYHVHRKPHSLNDEIHVYLFLDPQRARLRLTSYVPISSFLDLAIHDPAYPLLHRLREQQEDYHPTRIGPPYSLVLDVPLEELPALLKEWSRYIQNHPSQPTLGYSSYSAPST